MSSEPSGSGMRSPRGGSPTPGPSSATNREAETLCLKQERKRSRSPLYGNSLDSVPRSDRSRSRSPRAMSSRDGVSNYGTPRERAARTPRERNSKISHILIKHKGSRRPIDNNARRITRSKKQAMRMVIDIHEKISRDLITFADAAFSYSECTSARQLGDIQKQFKTGLVQKSFEDAAFNLNPGQLSRILESDSGFHILQCRE